MTSWGGGWRVRPQKPYRTVAVMAALALALTGIGRTTGSGWAMVVVSGLVAVIVLGALWPAWLVARTEVRVRLPRDAEVGRPVDVTVEVRGPAAPVRVRLIAPAGDWIGAEAPAAGSVAITPARRGVLDHVVVEVATAAPLGLLAWGRRSTLAVPVPLEIAPRVVPWPVPTALAGAPGEVRPPHRRSGNDSVRTVREYVQGDSTRLVHWGATARRGELMVKEMDDPEGALIAVVVDLRGPDADAELAASRAAGLVQGALRARLSVLLLTHEAGGPCIGGVVSALEAGRRLARATAGPPPTGPVPPDASVVHLGAEARR
ncbi:MAG TPA: DUF58 domain-containing protein [Acidimicrobiales bacterium]|nr:DUF58 domain-containing protein [Acidimicrobiales bacterium]